MTREFIILPEFDKAWKHLGLSDNELKSLQQHLCLYPDQGDIIQGTGGLRKLRWAIQGKGKSGGIRVAYVDFVIFEKIYLITAYSKGDKDNLSKTERNDIKKLISLLENELKIKNEGKL
ncbi:MAG TPA: type II toxin-antitoxin system RelE/ParE family toxin [Spirochaetota bacterium]|nr:type II toxin-antitoxin system RelE/ParE family toxin [Spirochaetota bacterium]HPQ55279.1 type II toxin-antitoxin system RelE/ParE family toxin [Spirochaetota bacterium]